jgi:hypothetical protein
MVKLVNAKKLRKVQKVKIDPKAQAEKDLIDIVNEFINGKLREEIMRAVENGRNRVHVEVPIKAYTLGLDKFYAMTIETLQSLEYTAQPSHDGGGMYNTIYVEW